MRGGWSSGQVNEAKRLRLFVAVTPPAELLESLEQATRELRSLWSHARWIAPENQHLTLKFLGWSMPDRVDAIKDVIDLVARSHVPAEIGLEQLGSFPSSRRVRILWVGLDDPQGLLVKLAADLERAFEPLGYPAEERAFRPHLTLARFKNPIRLDQPLPAHEPERFGRFEANELQLFQSHLHPRGARYEVLARFRLGEKAA